MSPSGLSDGSFYFPTNNLGCIILIMRKNNIVLILAFGLLLVLLLLIGAVGVKQINVLTKRISDLALMQVPLQKNVLGMKNSAQLYSSAVRNYVSWRIGKYFGAVQLVADEEEIDKISQQILEFIGTYPKLAGANPITDSVPLMRSEQLLKLFKRMHDTQKRIVNLVDASVRAGTEKENSSKIAALLVNFENQTFQFSQFVEKRVEPLIFQILQEELEQTQKEKTERIFILLLYLFFAFILGLLIAILVMRRLIAAQKHSELLVNHILCAEERERRNLSFAMHNQMGQDLSALKIYMGIMVNKYGENDELSNSKKIIERLLERMHNIADLLCPPALEDFGLEAMLSNMLDHYRTVMSSEIKHDFDLGNLDLQTENALVLYRVVQEALTNIVKHADADNVRVSLNFDGSKVNLEIEDDGIGFELKKAGRYVREDNASESHLGLLLLQERLSIFNAQMSIITARGQGTKIVVQMPIVK